MSPPLTLSWRQKYLYCRKQVYHLLSNKQYEYVWQTTEKNSQAIISRVAWVRSPLATRWSWWTSRRWTTGARRGRGRCAWGGAASSWATTSRRRRPRRLSMKTGGSTLVISVGCFFCDFYFSDQFMMFAWTKYFILFKFSFEYFRLSIIKSRVKIYLNG